MWLLKLEQLRSLEVRVPINSEHPHYHSNKSVWIKCRDVINSNVKSKGETYLPRLAEQTDDEYKAYKDRALFFSVAGRSMSGLTGMMTRRKPTIIRSDKMRPYFEDISSNILSFEELLILHTEELLTTARLFVIIDWPEDGGNPYPCVFIAEDVINWHFETNGLLSWVVVKESIVQQDTSDPYVQTEVMQYRKFSIETGVYTVTVYDADGTELSFFTPKANGVSVTEVPGWFVNTRGLDPTIVKPPMLDIVEVNLSQYLSSADLEHGRRYTALPTPVISGAAQDSILKIGSMTAWIIPENAKAYYLEFLGEGLKSLENAISEKTSQMAQFSARLMDTASRGSEAADTVRLRHSSEAATLSSIAFAIQYSMSTLYNKISSYISAGPVSVELNKDFLDTRLSHADLKQLTESYLSGAIDQETFFWNLYRGELVPEHKTEFTSTPIITPSKDGV